jgi:hypothetical protein
MKMKVVLSLLGLALACYASDLPVVDLGYELHQAISLNVSIFHLLFQGEIGLTRMGRVPLACITLVIFDMPLLR